MPLPSSPTPDGARRAPGIPLVDADPTSPTVNLWFLRRALGKDQGSARLTIGRMVKFVEALIAADNFPPPLPGYLQGTGLVRDVTERSAWRRDAVEGWLAGYLPPAGAAALNGQAMIAAAAEMDASARNLRLIRGGRP